MTRLITADTVCSAAQGILTTHMADVATSLGLDQAPAPLGTVRAWDQVPTLEALTTANFPAGAITSPGLVTAPTRRGTWGTGHDATWRLVVGIYDKGGSFNETAHRVRTWAALIRATLLLHPSLGGLASSLSWVGEEYRQITERKSSRTIGGCAVAFDVTVDNVIDPAAGPLVLSTQPTTTVRPVQE